MKLQTSYLAARIMWRGVEECYWSLWIHERCHHVSLSLFPLEIPQVLQYSLPPQVCHHNLNQTEGVPDLPQNLLRITCHTPKPCSRNLPHNMTSTWPRTSASLASSTARCYNLELLDQQLVRPPGGTPKDEIFNYSQQSIEREPIHEIQKARKSFA